MVVQVDLYRQTNQLHQDMECILSKLNSVATDLTLGAHSLRVSGATVAAYSGYIDDRCLMRHQRWKSQDSTNMFIKVSLAK